MTFPAHLPPLQATAANVDDMQPDEIQTTLSSQSNVHAGPAAAPLMPPQEDSTAFVEQSRERLLDDDFFRADASYQQLVAFANSPTEQAQPDAPDLFTPKIEQMQGFGSPSDSSSSQDSGCCQDMAAVSLPAMSNAAQVVGDPNVAACYDHSECRLREWDQQQQRPSAGRGSDLLPSLLAISLAQMSPYALKRAARVSVPSKRSRLSMRSKQLMTEWFEHHLHHPYPTDEEKAWLAQEGGITLDQVNNWFVNTRGRKWKPMLNQLLAENQAGNCKLYDQMVQKIEEPYHNL